MRAVAAAAAVLAVCWLLTASLWASALMLLVIVMILVDMVGAMYLLGVQLNAVRITKPYPHSMPDFMTTAGRYEGSCISS